MKGINNELKNMIVNQLCDLHSKAKDLKGPTTPKSYMATEGTDLGDSNSNKGESSESKSALTIEVMLSELEPTRSQSWVLDSGASVHPDCS